MTVPHVLFALLWPSGWAWAWCTALRAIGTQVTARYRYSIWLTAALTVFLVAAATGDWRSAAGAGLSALAALIVWWWRRRKDRLRALRALGAKSRARLEALVRSMPRPSPRLVPQGVPA